MNKLRRRQIGKDFDDLEIKPGVEEESEVIYNPSRQESRRYGQNQRRKEPAAKGASEVGCTKEPVY